jgi:SPP1 gp7 family putative phage head morphogenesis protein
MNAPLTKLPTLFPAKRGLVPARKALEPIGWPHAPEHHYAATLLFAAKQTAGGIRARLLPRLGPLLANATGRHRVPRTDERDEKLARLMAELKRDFGISDKVARKWALVMLTGVNAAHAQGFVSMYADAIALNPLVGEEKWLAGAMNVATSENVALIKSIPQQLFSNVEQMVGSAVLSGQRVEALALDIVNRFTVAENRALLIARDQVGKWFGSLSRYRQLDAGVTEYRWSTSLDERVRRSHREREGKVYTWRDGPPGGSHPGHEVQCRCQAIGIIPDWEELTREE